MGGALIGGQQQQQLIMMTMMMLLLARAFSCPFMNSWQHQLQQLCSTAVLMFLKYP
jgi:hypothetical protein